MNPSFSQPISRRALLINAGALTAASLLSPSTAAERSPQAAKIVVTGGHPGDPEYGCGGTIARLAQTGHEVVLLYLNEGEPAGAPGNRPKGTRVAEAKKACELLKARPLFAGQVDGNAIVDREHYDSLRAMLENENPRAVFTHWPLDNHADHRAMFNLVYDAWLRLGKRFALFFYEVSNGEDTVQFSPTLYVNISMVETSKRAACYAHASQNPDRYYALQDSVAKWRGTESGFERAESFIHHVQSPAFALP